MVVESFIGEPVEEKPKPKIGLFAKKKTSEIKAQS